MAHKIQTATMYGIMRSAQLDMVGCRDGLRQKLLKGSSETWLRPKMKFILRSVSFSKPVEVTQLRVGQRVIASSEFTSEDVESLPFRAITGFIMNSMRYIHIDELVFIRFKGPLDEDVNVTLIGDQVTDV